MPGSFKDIIQTQETQIRSLDWEDPSRKWQPTPIFLLGKFHGQGGRRAKVHGMAKIWTRLSDLAHTHERTHAHTHTHTQLLLRMVKVSEVESLDPGPESAHSQSRTWVSLTREPTSVHGPTWG